MCKRSHATSWTNRQYPMQHMSWSYLQLCNVTMCSILASYAHAMQIIPNQITFPSPSRRNDKSISSTRLSSTILQLPEMDSMNEDPALSSKFVGQDMTLQRIHGRLTNLFAEFKHLIPLHEIIFHSEDSSCLRDMQICTRDTLSAFHTSIYSNLIY